MRLLITILFSFSLLFVSAKPRWDWNNPYTWFVIKNWYVNPQVSGTGTGIEGDPYKLVSSAVGAASKYDTINIAMSTTIYQGSTATGGNFLTGGTKDSIYIRGYNAGLGTAKPIWTGLKTIASGSLTNEGGGYYSYTDSDFTTYLNEFVLDGKPQPMRKVAPHSTGNTADWYSRAYGGSSPWSEYQATNGTSYIVDTLLTGSEGYAGSEIVFRSIQWNIGRMRVMSQSGDTIRFGSQAGQKPAVNYTLKQGWGYFIQGPAGTATAAGEWYFDSANKKVVFYLPDNNPAGHTMQVPIRSIAVNSSANGVTFDGIAFSGFYLEAYTGSGSYIKWLNCEFSLMGIASHYVTDVAGMEFTNCYFYDNQNTTIKCNSGNYLSTGGNLNWKVISCTFRRTGIVSEGNGYGNGDPMFSAFYISGNGTIMQYNLVDSTGYNGYHIQATGFLAEYNQGYHTNKYLSDGGIFYNFYGNSALPTSPARSYIRYNTFLYALGNMQGIFPGSSYPSTPFDPSNDHGKAGGIYMDENSSNVEMYGNNVGYCAWTAFMWNGTHDLYAHNNNVFYSWRNLYCVDFNTNATYAANNNRFISNLTSQGFDSTNFPSAPTAMVIEVVNTAGRTPSNILVADSNKYNTFYSAAGSIFYNQPGSMRIFSSWKTYIGSDANSTVTNRASHKFLTNPSADTVYQSFAGSWKNASTGGTEVTQVRIVPYGSVILVDSIASSYKIYTRGSGKMIGSGGSKVKARAQ